MRFIFPQLRLLLLLSGFLPLFSLSAGEPEPSLYQLRRSILGHYENDPARNERLAETLAKAGLLDEAVFYHRRAVELSPDSIHYKENLAKILIESGSQQEAAGIYRSILNQDPENEHIGRKLADLLEKAGDIAGAEQVLWDLYTQLPDKNSRQNIIILLTESALRQNSFTHLIDEIEQVQNGESDPCEIALAKAAAYETAKDLQKARSILEKEKNRETESRSAPDLFLLTRLAFLAEKENDIKTAVQYRNEINRLFPTAENSIKQAELSARFSSSLQAKEEIWRSDPSLFLTELPSLLQVQNRMDGLLPFTLNYLQEIPLELCGKSFGGIALLFQNDLIPNPQHWENAVILWRRFWNADLELSQISTIRKSLAKSLISASPELIKEFAPDLEREIIDRQNTDLIQIGFWNKNGWNSLFKSYLDTEPDYSSLISQLESEQPNIPDGVSGNRDRIKAILLFRLGKEREGLNLVNSLSSIKHPNPETLPADFTLFREMEKSPLSQNFLVKAYQTRLPMVKDSPDFPFLLHAYRKAAVASDDPILLEEAIAPLVDNLTHNFVLAAQTNIHGNVSVTDPVSGTVSEISIYEILNELLNSAEELKELGLSKKAAELYHQYGENSQWLNGEKGQGVFLFEELKKIIEESE